MKTFFFPGNKKTVLLSVMALLFCLLSILPAKFNETINANLVDLQFKIRGDRQLSDKIEIIFIGDEDVKALNGWPLSRDYYGYLIHILNQSGAKVIGLDILFDQADRNYPEYDEMLADLIGAANNVCLPAAFSDLVNAPHARTHFPDRVKIGMNSILPIDKFRKHAAGMGFSNFEQAAIVRKTPIIAINDDSLMLSFGCELARLYLQNTSSIIADPRSITLADSGDHNISLPIDDAGRLRLNHFGDIRSLRQISLLDVLQQPDSLNLKDKIAIIAVTVSSVVKLQSTPLSSGIPATLIHATVAENILEQNYLREIPALLQCAIILCLAMLAWMLFKIKNRLTIALISTLSLLLYWLIAMIAFGFANTIIPLFYPTIAFLAVLIYATILNNQQRRVQESSITTLLHDQVKIKESQLAEAKAKLSEVQMQLDEETTISGQTRELAEEQQRAMIKLEKELRDLQTYIVPAKHKPVIQFPEIIHYESSKMKQVLQFVSTIRSDDIPVLIMGETGTGKEMVAHAIHNSSKRKNAPFVAINCGALPETLLESELFGHEKGSFTGAHSRRRGRFEMANGGTIFLDEITETSPAFQTRLLRVLQEGCFERLGGEQTIKVSVRIIAATNKVLHVEMENNRFRSDLFYRLNGFPITIPPLRERREDIPLLAMHFLKKHGYHSITSFSDRAMEIMQQYQWNGNVRELENVVRRAAILAQSHSRNLIRESELPEEIVKYQSTQKIPIDFKPLEDQVLELLRIFEFSRAAISQTAKKLGNRDRGTITEYFRGICFENLVNSNYGIEAAANTIAGTTDPDIVSRVASKIREYLTNFESSNPEILSGETRTDELPSAFKGLPKKYHSYLQQIIENFDKIN
ncbi:sigma 54-interacting transcriptional regulator [candidate division KSB1 bacterium]|nr:sigma 54-interacting transcriptional regulator [candidate division KSB1 bacterium]